MMPSVERIQDVRSPNLDVSTEKETTSSFPLESLTWGCQKARGADGKRAPRVNVVVGKAALMNPNPQPFDFIAASQRARQTSVNPDSPGFTCLLQLADAGVQLEKRRATAWGRKTKPNANATRGGGKPTQVTTKENGAAVKKKTATKSLKQPTTRSDDVSERDSDDELSDVGETRHKKSGRGIKGGHRPSVAIIVGAAWPTAHGDDVRKLMRVELAAAEADGEMRNAVPEALAEVVPPSDPLVRSLHVVGKQDTTNPPAQAMKVAEAFSCAELLEHPGGHVVPMDEKAMRAYLKAMR